MTLIDRYLSRLWVSNFFIVSAFSVGLILIQETYNYFVDIMRAQLNLLQIAEFFLLSITEALPIIIPFGFFVSIIFTVIELQKTEQITILKSCGLSLFRISLPFWLIGGLLCLFTFLLSVYLIPQVSDVRNHYIKLCTGSVHGLERQNETSTLTFENHKSNRLWYIEQFDAYALKGRHSILHQMNQVGVEISRILAESSAYDQDLETWTFSNGTELIFDPMTGDPLQLISFESKQFIKLEEDPEDFMLFDKAIKDLSPNEIKKILSLIEEGTPQKQAYLSAYYRFFSTPLLSLVYVGITLPFLTKGVRRNSLMHAAYPIGLFIAFFALRGLFMTLGQNLLIPALFSAIIPFGLYFLLSFKLYYNE